MGNFNKGKSGGRKFGGGGGFGSDRGGRDRGFGGGGRDRERPEMHKTVCSDCGNSCEVPFRPTGDKPVFCSDCFKNKRGDSQDRGGSRGNRDSRPNKSSYQGGGQDYKAQFEILNVKLDKIIRALNPDITEELFGSKSESFEKAPEKIKIPKKEVDTKALKKAIDKTKDKKPSEKKKVVIKKVSAKKLVVKKKK